MTFSVKKTGGKKWLKTTHWTVARKKWKRICKKVIQDLHVKVLGKIRHTKTLEFSNIQVLRVEQAPEHAAEPGPEGPSRPASTFPPRA